MAFIGDSLSSGEFESRNPEGNADYHDYFEYSWGQYIARKNGLKAYNFSRGGMTAGGYQDWFAKSMDYWNPEYAAQAYVLALGVNDIINCDYALGTVEDINIENCWENKDTFAGYYGRIIQRYKEIQPRAKFFLVTMPRENYKDDKREAHAKLLYDMAELFDNCYVIDLYKYAPVYDAEFKKNFYLYDHMSPTGYIFTANIIDSYIDYIIRKNPEDFKKVPFIGGVLE